MLFRALKTTKPFLQFGFIALAFYIALTRISDYKHHPTDVITGILLGTIVAVAITKVVINFDRRPRIFHRIDSDVLPVYELENERHRQQASRDTTVEHTFNDQRSPL